MLLDKAGLEIRGSNGSKCHHVLSFATGMLKWSTANICYCHIMHGIVNLMHACLCSVCNAISYTTQDDRGSRLLRQNKTKIIY